MKKYTTLNLEDYVYQIHPNLVEGNSTQEIESIPHRYIRIALNSSVIWLLHLKASGITMTAEQQDDYNKMVTFYDGSYIPPVGQVYTQWKRRTGPITKTFDGVQTLKAGYEEINGAGTWQDG